MVIMKPVSGKITHNRVAVNNLGQFFSLPKLPKFGYFDLQSANSCAKMAETLRGLKEEGDSREPVVRRNVSGLYSALVESERGFCVRFFRPESNILCNRLEQLN